jgi:acyl carrier protein
MNHQDPSQRKVNESRPTEQEAVCTTIVGGRPPGCGQTAGAISRGIEVLIKKAAVDEDFKSRLMETRADAAKLIGLTLLPAEAMMLAAVPASQLKAIIDQTTVPQEHRRAFLGYVAAAMLASLGIVAIGCGEVKGSRPDVKGTRPEPPAPGGCRPGPKLKPEEEPLPPAESPAKPDAGKNSEIEAAVYAIVAKQTKVDRDKLSRNTSFVEDLHIDSLDTVELVMEIEEQFKINIPDAAVVKIKTIGDAIDFVARLTP